MKKTTYILLLSILLSNFTFAQMQIVSNGNLTIEAGTTVNIIGDLTIESDETGNASLLDKNQENCVTVGGTTKSELYITANGWHYLSSPLSNLNKSEFTISPWGATNPNFYSYNESIASQWNSTTMQYEEGDLYGWENPLETELVEGRGYAYYLTSNHTHKLSGGTYNSGDLDVTVTNTNNALIDAQYEGWNLVGNPYPTALDWDIIAGSGGANLSGISNEVHFWTGDDDFKYADYNSGVGTNGGTNIIPAMQSFMVKCTNINGSAILTLPNNAKIWNTTQSYYKNNSEINNQVVKLKATNNSNTNYTDETVIRFTELAKNEYLEDNFDALKLPSNNPNVPNIYTLSSEKTPLSINSLFEIKEDLVIPFVFSSGNEDYYTISVVENSIESYTMFLHDSYLKKYHNLTENPEYQFHSYRNNDINYSSERFSIVFKKAGTTSIDIETEQKFDVYSNSGKVFINSNIQTNYSVEIYDINGRIIYSENNINNRQHNFQINTISGIYIVKLISNNVIENYKIFIN